MDEQTKGISTMMPVALQCLMSVLSNLQSGHSVHAALRLTTQAFTHPFYDEMKVFLVRFENGRRGQDLTRGLEHLSKTSARRALVQLYEAGLTGNSIVIPLKALREEFFYQCEVEYEKRLQILPLKLLIPLLLGFLPAVLCLLIGPALFLITSQLGGSP